MKQYAVIGDPVAHSLSPKIHAAFARNCAITMEYRAVRVAADDLAQFIKVEGRAFRGMNVTLPHKEAVVDLLAQMTPRARAAGAVNTLIASEEGWRGDNTDGIGLVRDLARLRFGIAGQHLVLIGAGGAARGVVPALLAAGAKRISIVNRTQQKADRLAAGFSASVCSAVQDAPIGGVIHTTSAGHAGTLPAALEDRFFAAQPWAYDLSYGDPALPFLNAARTAGTTRVSDGLGMLIEQAAESFYQWHGIRPETAPVHTELG